MRCMPHLKRREADDAVSAGRVRVNGELVRPSRRVVSGDVVTLDGRVQDWEAFAEASESSVGAPGSGFAYLKYNKPRGVTCTMEASQRSSMMYALKDEIKALHGARLFPVGRLDRDSSGLVLLTDDGRVPEALLDPERKAPKVYEVDAIPPPTDADIARLAAGVTITTTQQRTMQTTTAPTLPCEVRRIDGRGALRFTLCEGRNRQIRKMCETVGSEVTRLHRLAVGDVSLGDLEVGGVRRLEGDELEALRRAVAAAANGEARGQHGTETRRVKTAPDGWGARIAAEADANTTFEDGERTE